MLFASTFIYISELDNLITETVRFNKFGRKMEETDVFMRFFFLNQSLVLLLAPGTSAAMLCVTLLPFPPSSSHGAGRSAAVLFLPLKPLDQGPGDERGAAACSAQPIDHSRCPSARAPCFWAPQSLVKPSQQAEKPFLNRLSSVPRLLLDYLSVHMLAAFLISEENLGLED